jgi:hypothetical protein
MRGFEPRSPAYKAGASPQMLQGQDGAAARIERIVRCGMPKRQFREIRDRRTRISPASRAQRGLQQINKWPQRCFRACWCMRSAAGNGAAGQFWMSTMSNSKRKSTRETHRAATNSDLVLDFRATGPSCLLAEGWPCRRFRVFRTLVRGSPSDALAYSRTRTTTADRADRTVARRFRVRNMIGVSARHSSFQRRGV